MSKKIKSPYRDIMEIAAAFVVAWLFYQLLAAVTGSAQPVVSVVSSSMEHKSGFDEWWAQSEQLYKQYGISKEGFQKFPMPNGLHIGDILLIAASNEYKAGDIIVYHPESPSCFPSLKPGQTIIHRIIKAGETTITKGDNAGNAADRCNVEPSRIVGKAAAVMPLLGYPRIALFAFGV